ncbi:MAG: hypothetical protein Q7S40_24160 [Opitutaceae bacterium]|nr:hypothetical protein [Opitutaceae bacterium]
MRLVRAADGATVYDEPIEFHSGTSLFVNWTSDRGAPLRRVAETGYREMAEQIVQRFFANPPSSAI